MSTQTIRRSVFFLLFCLNPILHAEMLKIPPIQEGAAKAGKRVNIYLDSHPNIYYSVFLPYNYNDKISFPVICEIPANCCNKKTATGTPDTTTYLGYGITKGYDYIWVSLPILNSKGDKILQFFYPDDPQQTALCWLSILEDLNHRFNINNRKIILSGFSRGAVCTSFIGNCNDTISSKWAAYLAQAHFDGDCQVVSGNADTRIQRIGNRPVLIIVGKNDIAKFCSQNAFRKLSNLGCQTTYMEVDDIEAEIWYDDIHSAVWANKSHTPCWALKNDSIEAVQAKQWLDSVPEYNLNL